MFLKKCYVRAYNDLISLWLQLEKNALHKISQHRKTINPMQLKFEQTFRMDWKQNSN